MNIYINKLSFFNQFIRLIWIITWFLFAKPFPARLFNFWKILLLKLFGAKIGAKSVIYSNAIIYQPWKLKMGSNSCIASNANIYNVDDVIIGDNVTISQGAYICTATHNYDSIDFELITKTVIIEDNVWVAADAFVNLGVTLGNGAVIAARAYVYKDVSALDIVGGNPAKFIKKRNLDI